MVLRPISSTYCWQPATGTCWTEPRRAVELHTVAAISSSARAGNKPSQTLATWETRHTPGSETPYQPYQPWSPVYHSRVLLFYCQPEKLLIYLLIARFINDERSSWNVYSIWLCQSCSGSIGLDWVGIWSNIEVQSNVLDLVKNGHFFANSNHVREPVFHTAIVADIWFDF